MAVPGDKVYNSCLPFGETHQKLLATILIVLGLFALLEYAVKLIALLWITFPPFLRKIYDFFFKKDPVKVTVKIGNPHESKAFSTQLGRKNKAYYSGEWSSHHDTDDKKASWHKNEHLQDSQGSSHLSDPETPQPACPVGSVASWVRFSFSSPVRTPDTVNSSANYGVLARSHQRATGDKLQSSEVTGGSSHGQRFLTRSVGLNTDGPAPHHLTQPHEPFHHPNSETNFIPSPILPGPRRVLYSTFAPDTASRTHLNAEEYVYPHSPRGHQPRLGLEWHQHLPTAQQAEVYVYLVSPPHPRAEHRPEQPNQAFPTSQAISRKEMLENRISLNQSRGGSNQGPAVQGGSDSNKPRKSIWERKRQRRSLQPTSDHEKLVGSNGGVNVGTHEPFSHSPSLLVDRGKEGLDATPPNIAS
ncbi:uncharacterized protein LOC117674863 isoform X2 [Pantherophis guttatus]|uniref:Uncharacterized protein LOC117674863 isoform X2 n=1 Tax=Pantherophis guttatus TaxID=94885 RepID=A0ABM3ZB51_PANGU|nr:uncharacterized protein LOC117674863 isoform X2 [Pantherophis guttatus]